MTSALTFTGGSSDRIEFPNPRGVDLGPRFTIWLVARPTANQNNRRLFWRQAGSDHIRFEIRTTRRCALFVAQSSGNAARAQGDNNTFTVGEWQFFSATYDETAPNFCSLYSGQIGVDAELIEPAYQQRNNGSAAGIATQTGPVYIGNSSALADGFPGDILHVGLHNDALTLEELNDVYRNLAHSLRVSCPLIFNVPVGFHGTAEQIDWAQGNIGTQTGTVFATGPLMWLHEPIPRRTRSEPSAPAGIILTAETGVYALSGQEVALAHGRRVEAETGLYGLSGQDVALHVQRLLVAEPGLYALSGQDVDLLSHRVLVAETGLYALAGQDVNLVYTPVGAIILDAETGLYTLSGQDAILRATRRLVAETGLYVLSGQDVVFLEGIAFLAETGIYTLSGQNVDFAYVRNLLAETGLYVLAGQNVNLIPSGIVLNYYAPATIMGPSTGGAIIVSPSQKSTVEGA